MKLAKGDKVAIVCCSNGQSLSKKKEIENLKVILEEMGLISVFSKYIYQKISLEEVENNLKGFPESGSPLEKARELMEFYEDASIKAIFDISDNNHEGLSKEQARDLMSINDDVESIYRHINLMLREGDFSEIETVLTMRDQLFESIAEAIKSELTRINEARSNTKASMLYLTILTETKNMVLQSRNLLKSQQYFLKHLTGPKTWIK